VSEKEYKIAVVGGGIVGLSTERALLHKYPGQPVLLLEKEEKVASHQTGNNSGVIHSGLYYKPGSLKARLCVEGGRELAQFCRDRGVPHRTTGKVVVATREEEIPQLTELFNRGEANGVQGLEMIGPERLKEIEPHVSGVKALWVPGTGIVDYRKVCEALADQIREEGGVIQAGTRLKSARFKANQWVLQTNRGDFFAKFLVNCGGLYCDRIAKSCGMKPRMQIVPFRGEYYRLTSEAESLVKGLIYPVPNPLFPFLGVHFTVLVNGGTEAGPNAVLALKREGYRKFDFQIKDALETFSFPGFWIMALKYGAEGMKEIYRSFFKGAFVKALQRLVPEITPRHLIPGGAGVRAQALDVSGSLIDDFYFLEGEKALHVLNAPSPAATSSLPIGRMIADKITLPD
jgi:(S)-2-hydroxyglutarate dehydrogenase